MRPVFFFIAFLFFFKSFAQLPAIIATHKDEVSLIGTEVLFLEDPDGKLCIEDIQKHSYQKKFIRRSQEYSTFPATNSAYWCKVRIKNNTGEDLLLQVGTGWIGYIDFYYQYSDDSYKVVKTGNFREFSTRSFPVNQFWFLLSKRNQIEEKTFYLRLKSNGYILEVPLFIGTPIAFQVNQQKTDWFIAIYLGAVIAMIFYNLFIFCYTKEAAYLFYVLYMLIVPLCLVYTKGQYGYYWLFRNCEGLNFYFFSINNLSPLVATLFIQYFLKIKFSDSLILKLLYLLSIICLSLGCINLIAGISGHWEWWTDIFTSSSLLCITCFYFSFLILVLFEFKNGKRDARFIIAGWACFIIGLSLLIFSMELNLIPFNFLTREGIIIGNWIEFLLFSLALGDRINRVNHERDLARQASLKQAVENERLIREQNIILETKVTERTKELYQSNQNLVIQNQKLEDLNNEKDGLISFIAHDLKSPFNNILGLTMLTKMEGGVPYAVKGYFELIEKSVQNGCLMISDLLSITQTKFASKEIKKEGVNFISFTEEILKPLREQAMRKKIELSSVYKDIPMEIKINSLLVRRVIENLVSNAIKFTPPGKKVTIEIKLISQTSCYCIIVDDNGPGFTEEDKTKMFKRFQRLSAQPTGGENSTGLGLAIIQSLVREMNGVIDVRSELGKGSTFTITIPLS